jgi:histidyl-tRNA synthetase
MSTKPPSGTRDFLPADIRRREHVIGVVRRVYERYGFEPLETPAFENIETLLGKYGEEGNRLIFKILRRGDHEASGEADLALRYDLTVPLARVVAQYQNELPRLFKRYQIQPVWRADRPAKGRFREFFQCDIDAIGSTSPIVEAEQIAAVGDVLAELGFVDFKILVNDRRILTGLLNAAGVVPAGHETALIALDKLDKIGEQGVAAEFVARGIDQAAAERLIGMLRDIYEAPSQSGDSTGSPVSAARFDALESFLGQTAEGHAVEHLRDIVRLLHQLPVAEHVYVDPRLARGLSYYTGAIMEIVVPDLAGSLGGGGRYDHLIGMFLGRDVPACGFSLGLERIIFVMTERSMFPEALTAGAVDVIVTFMDDASRVDALDFASRLRGCSLRAEIYPEASRKFDKVLKHASSRGARMMAIFGENERTLNQVGVRDLTTREQQPVAREQAADFIAQRVREPEPRTES